MPDVPTIARRPLLVLLLLLAPFARARAETPPAGRAALDSLAVLLPDGPVIVELLAPAYPKRVEDIAVRMEASARRNPGWFQAYTRRYPVRPLPWHPNLGVTRAEYQEYLLGAKDVAMAVTQRATLTFTKRPGRRIWSLQGWGKLTPLNGLVLDLERNTLDGRRGSLPGLGAVAPDADSGETLGWRWYGVWKAAHQMGDPKRGGQAMSASLHLGPLADGRAALYWTYRRYNNGARLEDEFLLLRFPRP